MILIVIIGYYIAYKLGLDCRTVLYGYLLGVIAQTVLFIGD
jgi:hypothetical protein